MQHAGTPEYYEAMRLRKIWCEGNFSHQKERHNLRRTRKRGIERVTEQCLLSACALNLKRLVEILFLLQYSAIIPVRELFGLFYIAKTWVCQQHRNVTASQSPKGVPKRDILCNKGIVKADTLVVLLLGINSQHSSSLMNRLRLSAVV